MTKEELFSKCLPRLHKIQQEYADTLDVFNINTKNINDVPRIEVMVFKRPMYNDCWLLTTEHEYVLDDLIRSIEKYCHDVHNG